MNHKAFKAYQQTSVTTASPDKILLMLYEGCIKFVRIAKLKMQEKKIADKGKNVSKALAIISELINTLDHEVGGNITQELEALYIFMMDKLIEGNLNNKVEDLEAVEKILCTLHEAWIDVITNPRPDGVPSARLQPDLYEMYKSQQGNTDASATKATATTKTAATAVNLSADAAAGLMSKGR